MTKPEIIENDYNGHYVDSNYFLTDSTTTSS